jgi:serine protease Do
METKRLKTFFWGLLVGALIMGSMASGAFFYGVWLNKQSAEGGILTPQAREIVNEESVVTQVVEKTTPSVVTVSISKIQVVNDPFANFDFFFDFFGGQRNQTQKEEKIEQDIGTGFIISEDGLIVTNKHVVADSEAKYKVVIGKDEVLDVINIYRDPLTDLAILKVERTGLTPILMGDSDSLKVGQLVIAIGTALGEFRSTVTTGVISGLGRGIVAGSPFSGSEKLEKCYSN